MNHFPNAEIGGYLQFIKSILLKCHVIIWNYIGVMCKEHETKKKNAKMKRGSVERSLIIIIIINK